MPTRWTAQEEKEKYQELHELYTVRNLSISEVAKVLGISGATVYDRLLRLNIKPEPDKKQRYLNKKEIKLPKYSAELAELVGILLGDGHISKTKVIVTLGSKEKGYVNYVKRLFHRIFNQPANISVRKKGYYDVYFGSVDVVRFFRKMGLVENKVLSQVGIPSWTSETDQYRRPLLRGLFDTDGSIYKIRFGYQISFRNRSRPLLEEARNMLIRMNFSPSRISSNSVYLTRKSDLNKFNREIGSYNPSKVRRLKAWVGTEVVKPGTL